MFAKITIAVCAALAIAMALASPATAQASNKGKTNTLPGYTDFEKLWFEIPQGKE